MAPTNRRAAASAQREPSTHQLRLFVVLAEELHFGRAAERMFMTQPALSQQIRALESRLGIDLIDRTSREAHLTPAGEALLGEARTALATMDRIRRVAQQHVRDVHGHLVVGLIGAEAAMPYTAPILAYLHEHHPNLTVETRSLDFLEQIDLIAGGVVDAAFLRPPLPPEFHTFHLATEPRVACLPADDPLADKPTIALAELNHHTVIDVPARVPRAWWDHWTVNPRPDGTRVRYGPVATDIEPMLLAVARGQGMVFLPASARRLYARPGIAYRDVTDLPPCTAALTWLPKNHTRPAIVALREAATVITRRPG